MKKILLYFDKKQFPPTCIHEMKQIILYLQETNKGISVWKEKF
jgi:uncharacterized protein (DUF3820 family)